MSDTKAAESVDKLVTIRGVARRTLKRIDNEPVTMMVGTGLNAVEITLSKDYMAMIVNDVRQALVQRIDKIDAKLKALGLDEF